MTTTTTIITIIIIIIIIIIVSGQDINKLVQSHCFSHGELVYSSLKTPYYNKSVTSPVICTIKS